MKSHILRITLLLGLAHASCAEAYEQATHVWMTSLVYEKSVLGRDPSIIAALGSDALLPGSNGARLSPKELIQQGANDEDLGTRAVHHFFDPQNGGRALSTGGTLGVPSPSWVLEPAATTPNDFSFRDAQEYLYRGMVAPKTMRAAQLGLAFRALGQSIHHIQDMAQPQHTRNDQHLPPLFTSAYEIYSRERSNIGALPDSAAGYEEPVDLATFDRARKFWENGGKGMAEFSSRNFVSARTNFRLSNGTYVTHPEFPLPAAAPCPGKPLLLEMRDVRAADLLGATTKFVGVMGFFGTLVHDAYLFGTSQERTCNERSSAISVLHNELLPGLNTTITMNPFTYDAAHRYLIPRAISYSAAMINYFFRGKLLVSASTSGSNVVMALRNASSESFSLSATTRPGTSREFEVWYDAIGGARKQVTIDSGAALGATIIGPGGLRSLQFALPSDVDATLAHPFVLLFRGTIGNEEGIIAQTFSVSLGSLLVTPNYLPSDGISGPRVLHTNGSGWQLESTTGMAAGNVDWRGWQAQDLLTWNGPSSRYWGAGTGPQIFYGGRIIASAPSGTNTDGASIRYEGGVRTLNVAAYENGQLRIYSRPFATSYPNNNLYNASTNPLGWRLVASASANGGLRSPAFFNASGTEVQAITHAGQRVKLNVSGATSSSDTRGIAQQSQYLSRHYNMTTRGHDNCTQPYGGECTAYTSCSSPGGNYSLCSTFNYDAGTTSVDWNKNEIVPTEQTEGIACVDYRGDTEVLCRFTTLSHVVYEGRVQEDRDNQHTQTESCSGPLGYSGNITVTLDNDSSARVTGGTQLSVGTLSLKTYASMMTQTDHRRTTVNSIPPPLSVGSVSYDYDMKTVLEDNHVLYLDARRDLIVYMSNVRTDRLEAHGAGSYSIMSTDVGASVSIPGTHRTAMTHQLIVEYQGKKHVYESSTDNETATAATVDAILGGAGAGCANALAEDNKLYTTFASYNDPTDFISAHVYNGDISSVAVDSLGQLAMSVPILPRTAPSVIPTPVGTYNFISNGELQTLLPAATSSATYSPIRVIR